MRLTTTLILLFSFTINVAAAEMYKWRDENGNLHFSDQPVNDQKVEAYTPPDINSIKSDSKATKKYPVSVKARTRNYLRGEENRRQIAAARKRQEDYQKGVEESMIRAKIDRKIEKRRKRHNRLLRQRGY